MSSSLFRATLLFTVFVTGATVLILEVFAIRLLSPHFGTSMFVLSSVLTVVLLALALGYFFGGRLADRYPHPIFLYCIIATGGLALIALYGLAKRMLPFTPAIFPLTYGPLVLALLFFFLPAFLLGTNSPFVIALLTKDGALDTAGTTSGSVFFWSTLGSIVGSLSAGFFFIPFVGIETTLIAISILLSLGATTGAHLLRQHPTTSHSPATFTHLLIVSIATLVVCGIVTKIPRHDPDGPNQHTLYEVDGYYGHLRVYEEKSDPSRPPARYLRRDVNTESAIFQDSYEHLFEYACFSGLYPQLRRATTTSILILGGGAYTIPRNLFGKNPNLQIDVVELEPLLFPIAKKYFDLPETDHIQNYVMDARVFVEQSDKEYDFIFTDAFNSGFYIPAHLTTQEFFTMLKKRLKSDGLLMVNFIGVRDLPGITLTDSFATTLRSVFPNAVAFNTEITTPPTLQNIMFIANQTDQPLDLSQVHLSLQPNVSVPLTDLVITVGKNPQDQVVFTDDRSPAEFLVAKQIHAIQNTH